MKKFQLFILAALFIGAHNLFSQDTLRNATSLNLPFEHYGISFGNSYNFNGIRINFADKNVEVINGLNLTFWNQFNQNKDNKDAIVNGVSIGIIPTGGTMRGVNIGLLGVGGAHDLYGFNLSGIVV
ncbi:MAG: hypothetical protein Q8S01_01090, partial [Ignavibacteria bacterium]|nr:hypothetical protein [Ignavibacteria bacterium]